MTLGVLADTHIPDRLPRVPRRALDVLRDARVDHILHAGDLCRPRVLEDLRHVAPVTAVRGNRDDLWPGNWSLPRERVLSEWGARIVLTHGQRRPHELLGGLLTGRFRETPEDMEARLAAWHPDASVIVYGHSHVPRATRVGHTLLLNPGSLAPGHYTALGATLAILRIEAGDASADIVTVT